MNIEGIDQKDLISRRNYYGSTAQYASSKHKQNVRSER